MKWEDEEFDKFRKECIEGIYETREKTLHGEPAIFDELACVRMITTALKRGKVKLVDPPKQPQPKKVDYDHRDKKWARKCNNRIAALHRLQILLCDPDAWRRRGEKGFEVTVELIRADVRYSTANSWRDLGFMEDINYQYERLNKQNSPSMRKACRRRLCKYHPDLVKEWIRITDEEMPSWYPHEWVKEAGKWPPGYIPERKPKRDPRVTQFKQYFRRKLERRFYGYDLNQYNAWRGQSFKKWLEGIKFDPATCDWNELHIQHAEAVQFPEFDNPIAVGVFLKRSLPIGDKVKELRTAMNCDCNFYFDGSQMIPIIPGSRCKDVLAEPAKYFDESFGKVNDVRREAAELAYERLAAGYDDTELTEKPYAE